MRPQRPGHQEQKSVLLFRLDDGWTRDRWSISEIAVRLRPLPNPSTPRRRACPLLLAAGSFLPSPFRNAERLSKHHHPFIS